MAYIGYIELIESKFDIITSKKDKVPDIKSNQLKLEVLDTYKKDEKRPTNFKHVDDDDVINKAYLDENLSKIEGYISYIEKVYKEFKTS